MSEIEVILTELDVYPPVEQICKASDFALSRVIEYVHEIDGDAVVTVEDGGVHIESNKSVSTLVQPAQQIFDGEFAEKIGEIQAAVS